MHPSRNVPDVAVPLRSVACWSAVVLPSAYLPMVADGFDGRRELALFVGLLAAHAVALSLGHGHDP
ncbi:hypothetical protein N0B31_08710 [Salinirubellus salinus]|jgi:hypothetical protein|uniref:Uncharacterized protein n=1 Tax=Salinirubellus salinus TaxID=1364945 RepID=A0A9E7R860_9EURY|nr:hypothetical protein [Salinirubellus salinus]UWM56363.1 hypothetical protein N0B31_08710 [Salinirubellus salinus]